MNPKIKTAFTDIYLSGGWLAEGTNDGQGSTVLFAEDMILELPRLLAKWQIKTLLDASCGEFTWMRHVYLGDIKYIGADVIDAKLDKLRVDFPEHTWLELDVTEDVLPSANLWMCRDTMIHFPQSHIIAALKNFLRSDITYLLVSHQSTSNGDIQEFGDINLINWHDKPWGMPDPLDRMKDRGRELLLFNKQQIAACELLRAS